MQQNTKKCNQAIQLIDGNFSIHQLEKIPNLELKSGEFYSLTVTAEEISLVCNSSMNVDALHTETDWRVFKLIGPFEFTVIGVLKQIATILADNHISIFAVSTFDTDYILVKDHQHQMAMEVLQKQGYQWVESK